MRITRRQRELHRLADAAATQAADELIANGLIRAETIEGRRSYCLTDKGAARFGAKPILEVLTEHATTVLRRGNPL